jgi:hypothetical protein
MQIDVDYYTIQKHNQNDLHSKYKFLYFIVKCSLKIIINFYLKLNNPMYNEGSYRDIFKKYI